MQDLFNYYKNSLADGLCDEYKGYWRRAGNDKERLVRLALSQQAIPHVLTYCNSGRGVSKEYITENFADYINGHIVNDADGVEGYTYSLYAAFSGDFSLSADVLVAMWCNSPTIEIKRSKCPVLYIGCKSTVHITTEGFSSVRIYLFDDSNVILDDIDDNSSVVIYKYSGHCAVGMSKYCLGKVRQFDKELKL